MALCGGEGGGGGGAVGSWICTASCRYPGCVRRRTLRRPSARRPSSITQTGAGQPTSSATTSNKLLGWSSENSATGIIGVSLTPNVPLQKKFLAIRTRQHRCKCCQQNIVLPVAMIWVQCLGGRAKELALPRTSETKHTRSSESGPPPAGMHTPVPLSRSTTRSASGPQARRMTFSAMVCLVS